MPKPFTEGATRTTARSAMAGGTTAVILPIFINVCFDTVFWPILESEGGGGVISNLFRGTINPKNDSCFCNHYFKSHEVRKRINENEPKGMQYVYIRKMVMVGSGGRVNLGTGGAHKLCFLKHLND